MSRAELLELAVDRIVRLFFPRSKAALADWDVQILRAPIDSRLLGHAGIECGEIVIHQRLLRESLDPDGSDGLHAVLVHELVHAIVGPGHGRRFQARLLRAARRAMTLGLERLADAIAHEIDHARELCRVGDEARARGIRHHSRAFYEMIRYQIVERGLRRRAGIARAIARLVGVPTVDHFLEESANFDEMLEMVRCDLRAGRRSSRGWKKRYEDFVAWRGARAPANLEHARPHPPLSSRAVPEPQVDMGNDGHVVDDDNATEPQSYEETVTAVVAQLAARGVHDHSAEQIAEEAGRGAKYGNITTRGMVLTIRRCLRAVAPMLAERRGTVVVPLSDTYYRRHGPQDEAPATLAEARRCLARKRDREVAGLWIGATGAPNLTQRRGRRAPSAVRSRSTRPMSATLPKEADRMMPSRTMTEKELEHAAAQAAQMPAMVEERLRKQFREQLTKELNVSTTLTRTILTQVLEDHDRLQQYQGLLHALLQERPLENLERIRQLELLAEIAHRAWIRGLEALRLHRAPAGQVVIQAAAAAGGHVHVGVRGNGGGGHDARARGRRRAQ